MSCPAAHGPFFRGFVFPDSPARCDPPALTQNPTVRPGPADAHDALSLVPTWWGKPAEDHAPGHAHPVGKEKGPVLKILERLSMGSSRAEGAHSGPPGWGWGPGRGGLGAVQQQAKWLREVEQRRGGSPEGPQNPSETCSDQGDRRERRLSRSAGPLRAAGGDLGFRPVLGGPSTPFTARQAQAWPQWAASPS